ncbi:MAG: ribosome biogenesis/translation initiation ATPase RLI [Candidatus Bathyarchaeia archaeon]
MARIAVLDRDRCRPDKCGRACFKFCPMVRSRVDAISFEDGGDKPRIIEALCSGCGICTKKCPFAAVSIVNLPDMLEGECSHRFGQNMFKLYRLPTPQPSVISGLIGKNGIGKTTALKILAGEVKPNLGLYEEPPDWPEIVRYYRGSVLQDYLMELSEGGLRVVHKPQYVDRIPQVVSGEAGALLEGVDERGQIERVSKELQLRPVWDRPLEVLSGGELQRLVIAATICRDADVYLFDEPSSYLDVKQRIAAAKAIRSLATDGRAVVVAEHDLAVLDYLSDQVCVLYGEPSVYGIISHPYGVRVGINAYLDGYLPDENVRFREHAIKFHVKPPTPTWGGSETLFEWGGMDKSFSFKLTVGPGDVRSGEVIGILGANGIGKTTFVKLLAGVEEPDEGAPPTPEGLSVSYKPQYISSEYSGTVGQLLRTVVKEELRSSWYKAEVLEPMNLTKILDHRVSDLSGGELQRVAIALCLSKRAWVYLLDEPSAYLDVEERLTMARTIRRIVESRGVTAFVVEHDVAAQDFIADRIMVFTGEPGIRGFASPPMSLREGMNEFLKDVGVTFRRDPATRRPRVNKEGSRLDRHQKSIGEYYYVAETVEEEEKR